MLDHSAYSFQDSVSDKIPKKFRAVATSSVNGASNNDSSIFVDKGPTPVPEYLKSEGGIRNLEDLNKDTWDQYHWTERICSQVRSYEQIRSF